MAAGVNAEESAPERSLREDLEASLAQIEARDAAPPEPDAPPAPANDDVSAEAARDDGRDERGRFKAKAEAAPEAAPAPEAATPPEPANTNTPSEPAEVPSGAPKSWRADEAAEWAGMSEKARDAVLRREQAITKLTGVQDAERTFGREFAEIVRPHMDTINAFGVTPQFAVQALLANDKIMRTGQPEQKLQLARQMLADYGIDPHSLAMDPNLPSDPYVHQLQQKVAQLEARLTAPQQPEYSPLPPDAATVTLQTEIEAFRSDPAHPHFDAVRGQMSRLLETEVATSLEEAYRMAVAAHPSLSLTPPAPPVPARQNPEKTAAARRASLSVVGSPGPAGDPKPASLRDELRENLRQFGFTS